MEIGEKEIPEITIEAHLKLRIELLKNELKATEKILTSMPGEILKMKGSDIAKLQEILGFGTNAATYGARVSKVSRPLA